MDQSLRQLLESLASTGDEARFGDLVKEGIGVKTLEGARAQNAVGADKTFGYESSTRVWITPIGKELLNKELGEDETRSLDIAHQGQLVTKSGGVSEHLAARSLVSSKYYAFFAPIVQGHKEEWAEVVQSLNASKSREFRSSRKKMGIKHERVWLQHTQMGDFVVVYVEGKDPSRILEKMAASKDPFDQWLWKQFSAIHGLDGSSQVNELFLDLS
jgi:hypothetical protein